VQGRCVWRWVPPAEQADYEAISYRLVRMIMQRSDAEVRFGPDGGKLIRQKVVLMSCVPCSGGTPACQALLLILETAAAAAAAHE
jgi:hypothetical protein